MRKLIIALVALFAIATTSQAHACMGSSNTPDKPEVVQDYWTILVGPNNHWAGTKCNVGNVLNSGHFGLEANRQAPTSVLQEVGDHLQKYDPVSQDLYYVRWVKLASDTSENRQIAKKWVDSSHMVGYPLVGIIFAK